MIKLKDILMEQLIVPALSSTGTMMRTGFNLSKGGGNRGTSNLRQPSDGVDAYDLNHAPESSLLSRLNSKDAHLVAWRLFQTARRLPSTASDWNRVKPLATKIYKAMDGLGAGNTLQLLAQIKTPAELAAMVKNFRFDGETLYQWLHGETTISWSDVLVALSKFANKMSFTGIDTCKYGGCKEA
jgi:hypothetical protein